jgi:hypothetical protein
MRDLSFLVTYNELSLRRLATEVHTASRYDQTKFKKTHLHLILCTGLTLHQFTLHYSRADRHALTPKVAGLCRAFNDTTKIAFLSPNEMYAMDRLGHSLA